MLRGVVEEGSGTTAQVPGYRVAGKTGHRGQAGADRRLLGHALRRARSSASCRRAGPRLVVLVTVDEPRGAIWGGVVAAPAFAEIAEFALQYLEVPPDAPARATAS